MINKYLVFSIIVICWFFVSVKLYGHNHLEVIEKSLDDSLGISDCKDHQSAMQC